MTSENTSGPSPDKKRKIEVKEDDDDDDAAYQDPRSMPNHILNYAY